MKKQAVYPLRGVVQDYAWGGYEFLPDLIDIPNEKRKPFAELWMGTHAKGTSELIVGKNHYKLDEAIIESPRLLLGDKVARKFDNSLPFLFKVLDVRKMLSIQAHPTKKAAEAGFQRENEEGVSIRAGHRNYRDDNHKPEIMVALTDFWLLHGFRPIEEIKKVLDTVPEFKELKTAFESEDLRQLYQFVMELPQEEVDRILAPMFERLKKASAEGQLSKNMPEYWAFLAFEDYTRDGHFDRGIFSIYFFNLVFIPPGEGIYQAAGIPHAYLEGVNVELMANSDNVFRGGLTPKHVDVPELMKHLIFEPVVPHILKGQKESPVKTIYPTPAPDFELSRIILNEGQAYVCELASSPAISIVMSGEVIVTSGTETFKFKKGESFFTPYSAYYMLRSEVNTQIFQATVGHF